MAAVDPVTRLRMRPVRFCRISQPFAAPGSYASNGDEHGRAGHHTGIDFGSAWPVPIASRVVRSTTSGRVVISEYNATMGHWVGVYYRRDNVTITYWHMAGRFVRRGQWIEQGHVIGRVGSTGNSSAPHLHVQVNRGRGFDYDGHIHPAKWCTGDAWWRRFLTRRRAVSRKRLIRD